MLIKTVTYRTNAQRAVKIYQINQNNVAQFVDELLKALAQAGETRELPGEAQRSQEELNAFDSGFTCAVLKLRSMGHINLSAELAADGEELGVTLDETAISAYFGAGLP